MTVAYMWGILLTCLLLQIQSRADFDPNAVSHTSKVQLTTSIEKGDEENLVYFYTNFDQCPKCRVLMPLFQEAASYLDNLEEGKVKSYKLAVKFPEYGVTSFPQLVLFLGKIPFRYDKTDNYEPDDIVDWIEEAKQTPLPDLNDETFEHLTQASTGATTGDWLVLFGNRARADCMKPVLADLATVAARMRRRKNVATLDTAANPVTTRRFGFSPQNHCVKLLFFHRTDLYHYDSDDVSSAALLKFIMEGYKDEKAVSVPPPLDKESAKLEDMIGHLTSLIYEHANAAHTSFFSGLGFGLLAVLLVFLFVVNKFRKKKML